MAGQSTELEHGLSERAQTLLKTLVERYIREGQPVGSRTLARDSKLDLSPATIRNVMADLEELGLVASPHTSAGRVPTARGYRLFVDSLLTVKPLRPATVSRLKRELGEHAETPGEVIESASSLLSAITRLAGVVMLPRAEQVTLRQVEFLPLSGNRVLVILVTNNAEVQNRIIHTGRAYSAAELEAAANYINREFAGRDLRGIREAVAAAMARARDDMGRIMETALAVADRAFEGRRDDDFVLAGQNHLLEYQEMADIERLRRLFEAFNTKRDILHLLDQSIDAEGVQIFIGQESGYEVLDSCSVVTSPYRVGDQVVGVLGVIGPTRMAYDRVIPIVDVTARLLGAALSSE